MYLRWIVRDNETSYSPINSTNETWTITKPTNSTGLVETVNANGNLGVYYSTYVYSDTEKEARAKYSFGTTLTNTDDIKKRQLVCLITTKKNDATSGFSETGSWNNNTYTINSFTENNFQVAVVFDIKTTEDLEKEFKAGSLANAKTIQSTNIVTNWNSTQTVDMATSIVISELGKIFTDNEDWQYIRLYIENNGTESNGSSITLSNDNSSYYDKTNKGWVANSNAKNNKSFTGWDLENNAKAMLNNLTVNIPNKDYSLVCLISKSSEVRVGNYLLTEPDIDLKLEVKFQDPPTDFVHYEGYANSALGANGQQQVHEYTYNIYIGDKETERTLELPLQDYTGTGNDLEPTGYYRWYNYDTDAASENLIKYEEGDNGTSNVLEDFPTDNSKGLFAWNLNGSNGQNIKPTAKLIGVKYKVPTDYTSWNGETIACDVSRYLDGLDDSKTYLLHEPTLSIRYIFKIHKAKDIADALKDAILKGSGSVYEDHGNVTVGIKDENTETSLRADLASVDDYYFYHFTGGYNNASPQESNFESTLYQATKLKWEVYEYGNNLPVASGETTNTYGNTMYPLTMKKNLGTYQNSNSSFKAGDKCYVVYYATDGTHSCPVGKLTCQFLESYPMTKNDANMKTYRTLDYMDKNYKKVASISFDEDNTDCTFAAPTSASDNMTHKPSAWNKREYGFVYYDLADYSDGNAINYNKITPKHGEYGLYKSANLTEVSQAGIPNFQWWQTGTLRDRTYEKTNGAQWGYFLYVDASHEPRPIASIDFHIDNGLCVGSNCYFSAAVADMTDKDIKPQLMFHLYGVDKTKGTEQLIHSFATGNFSTAVSGSLQEMTWYQVYAKITIQDGLEIEGFTDFRLEVDNYCKGTLGADYAIDDINVYTDNAMVDIYQDAPLCDKTTPANIGLRFEIEHETAVSKFGLSNGEQCHVYWRVYTQDGTLVTGIYDNSNKDYGVATLMQNPYTTDGTELVKGSNCYQDESGLLKFIIAQKQFSLATDKNYYVSLYNEAGKQTNGSIVDITTFEDSKWGRPGDICSFYSNIYIIQRQEISLYDVNGNIITNVEVPCGKTASTKDIYVTFTIPDPVNGATVTTKKEDIAFNYSIKSPNGTVTSSTTAVKNIENFSFSETGTYTITITLPSETTYTIPGSNTEVTLCNGEMVQTINVQTSGPELTLGFPEVTYPNNYQRVLRIGTAQIADIASNKVQQLPIHSYENLAGKTDKENFNLAIKSTNNGVFVSKTNDPTWNPNTSVKVGTVSSLSFDNVEFTFSGDYKDKFHEGYWYELHFQFYDKTQESATSICYGDVYFTMKVVPEYVSWTGKGGNKLSTNWTNDENWTRAKTAEMYKGNTYIDYEETETDNKLSQQDTYIPMKFTKVIVHNNKQFPSLVAQSTTAEGILTDASLTNGDNFTATENVQYDFMCKELAKDSPSKYTCEKFYTNTCDEIYFKPDAELLGQQYLTYNKARVELELTPNKWYTVASPLQDVYAGDFYVPYNSTNANGRQETDAFAEITYDTRYHSRWNYPIYQRSWDDDSSYEINPSGKYTSYIGYTTWEEASGVSSNWSHVFNDVSVNYDSGKNGFAIMSEEASPASGKKTLIRLPKDDSSYNYYKVNGSGQIVVDSGTSAVATSRNNSGKLKMDINSTSTEVVQKLTKSSTENSGYYLVSNPYMASLDMTKFFEENTDLSKKYWIVVDDEMKSVDLTSESSPASSTDYTVAPLQSFLVKNTSSAGSVTFTPDMTTAIKNPANGTQAANYSRVQRKTTLTEYKAPVYPTYTLTATRSGKKSEVKVVERPDASDDFVDSEDVETILDSNLADVPSLYVVASNQTVAVDAVADIDNPLSLGVVCEGNEEVSLTIGTFKNMGGRQLYVLDAKTGFISPITSDETISIVPNDHGRYYLTTRANATAIENVVSDSDVKAYSPALHTLVVSALGSTISSVKVFSTDGRVIADKQVNGSSTTLKTISGVNIVNVETADGENQTIKVNVR